MLVWNADMMSNKFQPKWRGPYVLTEQVSKSVWAGKSVRKPRRGRQPILKFHVDHLQPFDL